MGAAVEALVRWLAENPAEAHILIEAATLGGRPAEARREIIESHVRSVAAAMAHAAPKTKPAERAVMARCWVGSVLEAATHWLQSAPASRPDVAQYARIVKGFNLRGAGTSTQRRAPRS
jgi:hypothetical protein